MPGMNGIDATREIHSDLPDIGVIGLSMHEEGELSASILASGAVAYVTKGGPPEALISAIRRATENKLNATPVVKRASRVVSRTIQAPLSLAADSNPSQGKPADITSRDA